MTLPICQSIISIERTVSHSSMNIVTRSVYLHIRKIAYVCKKYVTHNANINII